MFFSLSEEEQKGAWLSDACTPLMNVYRVLADCPELLVDKLKSKDYANTQAAFLKVRTQNFEHGDYVHRAADFLYCNKAGFNGLFRTNKSGQFNVPFGRYNQLVFDVENLRSVSETFVRGRVTLKCCDYQVIEPQKGDFVYLDPPYIPLSATSNFEAYTPGGFGLKAHEELAEFAFGLKKFGVHVVLSNSSASVVRQLYKDFEIHEVQAARAVNSKADKRGNVTELLIR